MAIRLHMEPLAAVATWFEAHYFAQLGDLDAMEERIRVANRIGAENPLPGRMGLDGFPGLRALLDEDHPAALHWMSRGVEVLEALPPAGRAQMRGVWPLLAAVHDDPRAASALVRAREQGVTVNRLNVGLLGLAEAVLTGRAGDRSRAERLTEAARTELVPFSTWGHLGLRLTAQAALADGWGSPVSWLSAAAVALARPQTATVGQACKRLRDWAGGAAIDLTAREQQVLALVAAGLANKEIGRELGISTRTVEKHVEALLRKTARRSRSNWSPSDCPIRADRRTWFHEWGS